jgi:hypothetical protein
MGCPPGRSVCLFVADHVIGHGVDLFREVGRRDCEGTVAKFAESPYRLLPRQECMGADPQSGRRRRSTVATIYTCGARRRALPTLSSLHRARAQGQAGQYPCRNSPRAYVRII